MFSEPSRTDYDLNFTLFGTSVRVHPFFWIAMLLLGGSGLNAKQALPWITAAFVSILVHEFGHVLAFRRYRISSHVVLHGFGGLAIPNSHGRLPPREQIVVSLAGPLAGFTLAFVLWLFMRVTDVPMRYLYGFPYGVYVVFRPFSSQYLTWFVQDLFYVNICWGLLNLMPIYPLDGGQTAAAALLLCDVRDSLRKALVLSMGTCVLLAVYGLTHDWNYAVVFFGYMGYQNYVMYQALGGRYSGSPW